MIEHKFTAVKDKFGRGWLGQFTYAKGAISCTAYVRDEAGAPRLFADASSAAWAASTAMCRSPTPLPVNPPPAPEKPHDRRQAP